jgi:hypothetical protein
VVFKTTAIDRSAIPPRRKSRQNSRNLGARDFASEYRSQSPRFSAESREVRVGQNLEPSDVSFHVSPSTPDVSLTPAIVSPDVSRLKFAWIRARVRNWYTKCESSVLRPRVGGIAVARVTRAVSHQRLDSAVRDSSFSGRQTVPRRHKRLPKEKCPIRISSRRSLTSRSSAQMNPMIGHYSYWSAEAGFTFRDVVVADNFVTAAGAAPVNGLTESIVQTYPPQ